MSIESLLARLKAVDAPATMAGPAPEIKGTRPPANDGGSANLQLVPTAPLQDSDRQAEADHDDWSSSASVVWSGAEIGLFSQRVALFTARGVAGAGELAERLQHRDRDLDDRRMCLECTHYMRGRCGNWRQAGIGSDRVGDLRDRLQRCPGFAPAIPPSDKEHDHD